MAREWDYFLRNRIDDALHAAKTGRRGAVLADVLSLARVRARRNGIRSFAILSGVLRRREPAKRTRERSATRVDRLGDRAKLTERRSSPLVLGTDVESPARRRNEARAR